MNASVLELSGSAGNGLVIARREGAGQTVLLADISDKTLAEAQKSLEATSYTVRTQHVGISSHKLYMT